MTDHPNPRTVYLVGGPADGRLMAFPMEQLRYRVEVVPSLRLNARPISNVEPLVIAEPVSYFPTGIEIWRSKFDGTIGLGPEAKHVGLGGTCDRCWSEEAIIGYENSGDQMELVGLKCLGEQELARRRGKDRKVR